MTATTNAPLQVERHRHTTACWFDHRQAAWVCAPLIDLTPSAAPTAVDVPLPKAVAPATVVDVRDMLVVHTAMLRECRLLITAVGGVPAADRRRAARVERHLQLLCDLLLHHHEGEDTLLWPVLEPRLPVHARAALAAAEAQHAGLDAALDRVSRARTAWMTDPDGPQRDELVAALASLYALLAEHLDCEERELLPLAAAYLTQEEWAAVGAAGAAAVPKSQLPLVMGMFAYEGDPAVLADMLHDAPAPVRRLMPAIGARVYARRAAQIYATTRP